VAVVLVLEPRKSATKSPLALVTVTDVAEEVLVLAELNPLKMVLRLDPVTVIDDPVML
jgi:hypothetical protein